jgi:hypothetical protein
VLNLTERDNFEDTGVDGKIIFKKEKDFKDIGWEDVDCITVTVLL